MATEKEKMIAGQLYDSLDAELVSARTHTRQMMRAINSEIDNDLRADLVKQAFGKTGKNVYVETSLSYDYGFNIHVGENFYMNFNGTFLDTCPVTIGDNCMFGPSVQIYTAVHPLNPTERNSGLEYGKPVTIGDNAWFGGGAIILPGVTLGNNVVVGSGAVVTKSFGDNVVLAGNPAKIIKTIEVDDKEAPQVAAKTGATAEEQLANLRVAIDAIDQQLAPLLANRLALSQQVGQVKKKFDLPIFNGGREAQILAKYVKDDTDVAQHFLGETFLSIIEVSKAYQQTIFQEDER